MVARQECVFLPREGQTREFSVLGTIVFLCCHVSGGRFMFSCICCWEFVDNDSGTRSPSRSKWACQAIACRVFDSGVCTLAKKNATVGGTVSWFSVVVGSRCYDVVSSR